MLDLLIKGRRRSILPPATAKAAVGRRIPDPLLLERSFRSRFGDRDYKLFVPKSAHRPKGLIVMLHGCTQTPDDFAAGTRMNQIAQVETFLVAYPAQSRRANPSACWNWFEPGDQKRGGGEPAIIAGLTGALIEEFLPDRTKVFVAGLSAGGAMAVVLGETYPEIFAAVGVHSGLPAGVANDVASALLAMRGPVRSRPARRIGSSATRTVVFHGDSDRTVHPTNGDAILAAVSLDLSAETNSGVSAGGCRYARTVWRAPGGELRAERWSLKGAGHAWSGGSATGSYTDPRGPDASKEMMRFFLARSSP